MTLSVNNSKLARTRIGVLPQLTALQRMSENELKDKWRELYGKEPPMFKKSFLVKRLAYRIQELYYGGLSGKAKDRIIEISADDPMANLFNDNKAHKEKAFDGKVLPGTRFVRQWNGNNYEVIAREKGFEFNGREYRSLSAVATEITGTKWNGKLFFGVTKRAGQRPVTSKPSSFGIN